VKSVWRGSEEQHDLLGIAVEKSHRSFVVNADSGLS
jgi:hypothetical protein